MTDQLRVLGINDGHNASAALVVDGRVETVVQEERLRGIKNWEGWPDRSIQAILEHGRMTLDDVDVVAVSTLRGSRPRTLRERLESHAYSDSPLVVLRQMLHGRPGYGAYVEWHCRQRRKQIERLGIPGRKLRILEHHSCHAASAYHGSGFVDDAKTLVLTLDGGGDGLSASVGIGKAGRIERCATSSDQDSLSNLYGMATFMLGMTPLEHEYKLMGLAAYTRPEETAHLEKRIEALIEVDDLVFRRTTYRSTINSLPILREIQGRERFDVFAGAMQRTLEALATRWVRNAIERTGVRRLALASGVFMNVKLNQRIAELAEVEQLFVFPSCGDESNAIGAAFLATAEEAFARGAAPPPMAIRDIYWGIPDTEVGIERAIESNGLEARRVSDSAKVVAALLAEGHLVARSSGRPEFGARALGNRSILSPASDPSVVRTLNLAIKMRTFWMPFAPSIRAEDADRYIVNPKRVNAAYMMSTFDTTEHRREIPAAIHPYDLTVRPQLVEQDWNPEYHELLTAYRSLTGAGAVLNTSFNLHGDPLVWSAEDAVRTFQQSGLEYLLLGDRLVTKRG